MNDEFEESSMEKKQFTGWQVLTIALSMFSLGMSIATLIASISR